MAHRIKLYSKYIYGFAELLNCVPYKYTFGGSSPDKIEELQNLNVYSRFAVFSIFVQFLFICNLYWEALFGMVVRFELIFIVGTNAVLTIVCTAEGYYLHPRTRRTVISITNSVLHSWFYKKQVPTLGYEICYLAFGSFSVIYPFLWLPCLLFMATYLPRMFRSVHLVTESAGDAICPDNPETAARITIILLLFILAVYSVALGHGVVVIVCFVLWLCTYHLSTVQSLQAMLENAKQ